MKNTSMQELIDYMRKHSMESTGTYIRAVKLLAKNKQEIIDAYDQGYDNGFIDYGTKGKDYFNETYNKIEP